MYSTIFSPSLRNTSPSSPVGSNRAHTLLASPRELLDPDRLREATGEPIVGVERKALSSGFAHSGSELYLIETQLDACGSSPPGAGPRFVLKRLSFEWDWLMQVTEDRRCRSVALWEHGLFDRLPGGIDTCIVSCSQDGEGWAILMRDVGFSLVTDTRFSPAQQETFLSAMAAMHATFLDETALEHRRVGLCGLHHVYEMFSRKTALTHRSAGREIHRRIEEGWRAVSEICPGDVVDIVLPLVEDPSSLVDALRRYPGTLVHGDFRHSNIGFLPPGSSPDAGHTETNGARMALLDWQLAVYAPPSVELGRYLGANSPFLPGTKEDILAFYRTALQRELGPDYPLESWWTPQLELGLLGGFVQDGWAIALKATTWDVGAATRDHWKADLEWWSERVRRGAAYL
ncbi:MAG: phosphotransferase [Spirochaetales bacterium]|nr:phosphotransferase [Spirochaetales bacterium]